MLTEICQYLKNWFNRKPDGTDYPKAYGEFTIADGVLSTEVLAEGQYFRIMGSLFNDGVHKYGTDPKTGKLYETLQDETFTGAVWSMGVPAEVVALADEIDAWQAKYGSLDSEAMSPFVSESFGGYSYSKGSGAGSGSQGNGNGWQSVYAARLNVWRKI